ncbi:putative Protein kinase domain containing protein [Blattamonas nauphoetae]|uniref:Uncharacterized protein n=1 Tax=Blattamonas nauphoetae TaxID=2049346 RepID=A0ABQ9YIL7_9EUKA|nr:putative Protein kinase domain containing protein [Blattamonas nauphoetae]
MKNEGSESLLMFASLLFLIFSSTHSFFSLCECGDVQVVVLICNDIVEGLKFMHTHPSGPTAHGDLKPENVLLSVDDRAILCDLGAADEEGVMMSHSAQEIGTYEYNSPERLDDDKMQGTPQSDMWSVGVILHRMVTGRRLFEGTTLPKMIREISSFTVPKLASTIPVEIRDVLLRLLDPVCTLLSPLCVLHLVFFFILLIFSSISDSHSSQLKYPSLRIQSSQLFDGCLFERMLGPPTPLSRMRGTIIQRQAKRIDDLTHFRFESEEDQLSFVPNSLHLLATLPSTMTVKRWTKSSDAPAYQYQELHIPFHPSFLIRDLAKFCDLGQHFAVGRRVLNPRQTFAEAGITPSRTLSAFPAFEGDPLFVVTSDDDIVPIDTSRLSDEHLSDIMEQIHPSLINPLTPFALETLEQRQLDLNISWKQNIIKPFSVLLLTYHPPYYAGFKIFVKTMTGKVVVCHVSGDDTIYSLKKQVENQYNLPADQQRLIYAGKQLENSRTVKDYPIQKDATLHLIQLRR